MKELLQIIGQIKELSGVAFEALSKAAGGGGGGKPEEGSPQEEHGESPQEAKAEGDRPGYDGDAQKQPAGGGQRRPFPPGQ